MNLENMSRQPCSPPTLTDLRPGDVLLMLGDSDFSRLIAWTNDSDYSHAALVVDDQWLIEASGDGVRKFRLQDRLKDTTRYHYIDVFRWGQTDTYGSEHTKVFDKQLTEDGANKVVAHAEKHLGQKFPLDRHFLIRLAVVMAVRGKFPQSPEARLLMRVALDQLVKVDDGKILCSELVWRSYDEADQELQAGGLLRLTIDPKEHRPRPFPEGIDWAELFRQLPPEARPDAWLQAAASDRPMALEAISDGELEQARQRALEHLARTDAAARLQELPGMLVNPRTVSPQDLADSPRLRPCGRLMERQPGTTPAREAVQEPALA